MECYSKYYIYIFFSEAIFFGCQKAGSYVQAMLEGKQVDEPKWNVVRYHHDPTGANEAKAVTVCQEIPDDIYGLTFHQDTSYNDAGSTTAARRASNLRKTLPSVLTVSVPDGFLVVMDPLEEENVATKRHGKICFKIKQTPINFTLYIIINFNIVPKYYKHISGKGLENLLQLHLPHPRQRLRKPLRLTPTKV